MDSIYGLLESVIYTVTSIDDHLTIRLLINDLDIMSLSSLIGEIERAVFYSFSQSILTQFTLLLHYSNITVTQDFINSYSKPPSPC